VADKSGPADHRLLHDPVSGAATARLRVGDRTLLALSDGFFLMHPTFLGVPESTTAAHDVLSAHYGEARLPLGCFFLPGDKNVLVDCGFGPVWFEGDGLLVGGQLPAALARSGLSPEDVDILAISHLHADHIGWVGDVHARPVFPNAEIVLARADWEYFLEGDGRDVLRPHIRETLEELSRCGRVSLLEGDSQIAPGITRLSAPGHTPGHSIYVVHDGPDRVLLFGDAMYCPQQLSHLDWEAASDVDPALARRTRETFQRDLELHGGEALGSHFPELIAGRAIATPDVS
jgi:glyoxylase-like metal-dependent hydrolase (beta-lactamase superfamily II)